MGENSVADEVVGSLDLDVVDWFAAGVGDRDDFVPEDATLDRIAGLW
ncbi:MAG: hypothetical protein AAB091_03945 [Elusimicrobiota bacterium]